MSEPVQPSTEPVLNAGTIAGTISAAVATIGMVLAGTGWFTTNQVSAAAHITQEVVFALVTVIAGLAPFLSAWHARRKVTPLTAPRDADGTRLVRDEPTDPGSLRIPEYTADDSDLVIDDDHSSSMGPDLPPTGPDTGTFRAQLDRDFEEWKAVTFHHDDTQEMPVVTSGIHAHPTKKLGRRKPSNRRTVAIGRFLGNAPAHPIADLTLTLTWPMDKNDVAGDCVVAGLDHALQAIHAALGVPRINWTDAQILAYYQTQNPGFHSWSDAGSESVDQGMDIQTFLEYLVKSGVILAFGKIDQTNEDEVKAAIYLGLAIVTGEDLETAQQTQTVWDYKRSGDWGGHCTAWVGYPGSPDYDTCVTWGQTVQMTQAFVQHQVEEAWFVLTQAHVDHPAFRAGFDLAGFSAAVSELTGGKVVVPVPAPQPPAPPAPTPPAPAPTGVTVPAEVAAEVDGLMARILARKKKVKEDVKVAEAWDAAR